jgi:hypothetical protein
MPRLYLDAYGRLSDPIYEDEDEAIPSPALADQASAAYWQGVADADWPDCDLDPFN